MLEGGPFPAVLLSALQSAEGMGCLAAAPPTRIDGRLGRAGPTRHEASSTLYMASPEERQGGETQEAKTATGRVRGVAYPPVDMISMCVSAVCACLRPIVVREER